MIHKESFIKSRRENILHFYDFAPKVLVVVGRNWERAPMEWFTKQERRVGLVNGEQLRRLQKRTLSNQSC